MNDFNIDRLDPSNDDGMPRRSRGKGRKGLNIPSRPAHQPKGAGRKPVPLKEDQDMDHQDNELAGSLPIDPPPVGEEVSEGEKNILDEIMSSTPPEPEPERVPLVGTIESEPEPEQTPPVETIKPEEVPAPPTAVESLVEWMALVMPHLLMKDQEVIDIAEQAKNIGLDPEERYGVGDMAAMQYYHPRQKQIIDGVTAGLISLESAKVEMYKVMVEASRIGLDAVIKRMGEKPVQSQPKSIEVTIVKPTITPAPLEQEKEAAAKAVEQAAKPVTKVYGGIALSVEVTKPGKPVDPASKPLYERVMLVEADGAQYWRPKFSRPLLPSDVIDARVIDLITGDARRQALFQLTPVLTICLPCQIEGDGGYWSADVKASADGVIITLKNPNEELAA